MESFDCVIVGGAAIGSSIAYHLMAEPGFAGRVLVIERDPTYAQAASALAVSGIRQQYSSRINVVVSLHGIEFLRRAEELLAVDGERPAIGLHEGGYLRLATPAGAAVLAENHALQVAESADILLLDPTALAARFAWLRTDDLGCGTFGRSGEGWYDGYGLMQAFRRKARALGATYLTATVTGVRRAGSRVAGVDLADGTHIGCGILIDAAGAAGARDLARSAGVVLPIEARKRCVFTFTAEDPVAGCPLLIDPSGVYVRPEGASFLCGVQPPADRDPETTDGAVDWQLFEEIVWPALAHRVPAFERIRPGRAWAGHYDMNLHDHNALVGLLPGLDNMLITAGFSGHGLQQSPAVGRGVAELVAYGAYRTLDLSPFDPGRIARGEKVLEAAVI